MPQAINNKRDTKPHVGSSINALVTGRYSYIQLKLSQQQMIELSNALTHFITPLYRLLVSLQSCLPNVDCVLLL